VTTADWAAWHDGYDDPESWLHQRLAVVRRRVAQALDEQPAGQIRVISACAGQGRDLLGVLPDHPRRADVVARLVELDPRNVERAREAVDSAGLSNVDVVLADASLSAAYVGMVPADVVLMCGVFGNISEEDIRRTVAALPQLCRSGGTVIWTRHTEVPDFTSTIRGWFAENGFVEIGFDAGTQHEYGVGMHVLEGPTRAFQPTLKLFDWVGLPHR
jgi:hypothetical protein